MIGKNTDFHTIFNNISHSFLFILTILLLISLGIFIFSWLKEPRRLLNGILFTIFLFFGMLWGGALISAVNKPWFTNIFIFIFFVFIITITLISTFSWLLFIWNGLVVWRHESHVLANMLTLILGIGLIGIWLLNTFNRNKIFPDPINQLLSMAPVIGLYLELIMYNFLLNLALYQFVPKRYNQDYLIVLGAGLIDGDKVSKLLSNRIDRAMKYYDTQIQKGNPAPKIIFSGGQGPDEKVSEAHAMAQYAMKKGLAKDSVLLEEQSKTTLENMHYSKEIATQDFGNTKFKAKFFSNNYHIFRAGLFAKEAGLDANGVGAKTRFYFLPNAVIREFAAIFMLHKKRHFIIIGLIALYYSILAMLSLFVMLIGA